MSRRLTAFLSLLPRPSSGGAFDIDVKSITSRPQSTWLSAYFLSLHCCGAWRHPPPTPWLEGSLQIKCKVNRKKAKRFEIVLHSSRTTFFRLSILARAYLRHTSEVRGEQQLKITAQIKAVFNHLDSWYLWAESSCDFESSPIGAAMLKMLLTCATRDVWPKKHVFRSKYHLDNLCEDCKTLKITLQPLIAFQAAVNIDARFSI